LNSGRPRIIATVNCMVKLLMKVPHNYDTVFPRSNTVATVCFTCGSINLSYFLCTNCNGTPGISSVEAFPDDAVTYFPVHISSMCLLNPLSH